MNVNDIADSYFRCIRAKDIEGLVALYAEDAVLILPNGTQVAGQPAIRELQEKIFAHGAPYPTPGPRVASGNALAVQIEARLADGSLRHTANFFTVNDARRIQRLSVYAQGG